MDSSDHVRPRHVTPLCADPGLRLAVRFHVGKPGNRYVIFLDKTGPEGPKSGTRLLQPGPEAGAMNGESPTRTLIIYAILARFLPVPGVIGAAEPAALLQADLTPPQRLSSSGNQTVWTTISNTGGGTSSPSHWSLVHVESGNTVAEWGAPRLLSGASVSFNATIWVPSGFSTYQMVQGQKHGHPSAITWFSAPWLNPADRVDPVRLERPNGQAQTVSWEILDDDNGSLSLQVQGDHANATRLLIDEGWLWSRVPFPATDASDAGRETFGNTLVVSIPLTPQWDGKIRFHAFHAGLSHEVGHNLCLVNRGSATPDCNYSGIDNGVDPPDTYVSSMNYRYQLTMVDYSTGANGAPGDHNDWGAIRPGDLDSGNDLAPGSLPPLSRPIFAVTIQEFPSFQVQDELT